MNATTLTDSWLARETFAAAVRHAPLLQWQPVEIMMRDGRSVVLSQMVGCSGDAIVVMLPKRSMTKAEALMHAAWLVALADDSDDNEEFKAVLAAVHAT